MFDIIPAIDVIDGKVARLTQGDYEKKVFYEKEVLEVAIYLDKIGITNLHLVDLIGAKQGRIQELDLVKDILKKTNLDIDFGGGIRSRKDIKKLLGNFDGTASIERGVRYINVGSLAIKNRELMVNFLSEFGAENFSIGIDVIGDFCYTNGWKEKSDTTFREVLNFYENLGVKRFNVTSIANDGMLSGIDTNLYQKIISEFPQLEIIASGGVKDEKDVLKAKELGCTGIIIGKAFYEGTVNIQRLKSLSKY